MLLLWIFYVFSVLCLLCLCARLFICALWSTAGKGLTSGLSFVVYNCEFVTFPLVSWVRCVTWLYLFLIFAPLLTFMNRNETIYLLYCSFFWWGLTPLGQTSDSMTVQTSRLIYWWDHWRIQGGAHPARTPLKSPEQSFLILFLAADIVFCCWFFSILISLIFFLLALLANVDI